MFKTITACTCVLLFVLHCVHSQDARHGNKQLDFRQTLTHAKRLKDHSQKYLKSTNEGLRNHPALLRTNVLRDVSAKATDVLLEAQETAYDVGSECLNHTMIFLEGLVNGEEWAFRMLDAMGKPSSSLLDLQLTWLGSWDECVNIEAVVYGDPVNRTDPTHPYTGQYCLASFYIGENPSAILVSPSIALSIGMCFPSSCNTAESTVLVKILEDLLPVNLTDQPEPFLQCQPVSLDYTGREIVALVVCSIFLALIAVATMYDVIFIQLRSENTPEQTSKKIPLHDSLSVTNGRGHRRGEGQSNGRVERSVAVDEETPLISSDSDPSTSAKPQTREPQSWQYRPGRLVLALLSFSAITNARKILNTNQPAGTLTAVNGIRFISMTWVILGHVYSTGIYTMLNTFTYLPELNSRLTFQAIGNATFSVDTFFVLSGLLVSFLSLREMKKVGGMFKFRWGMYYFHRFWRLTPPYMLVLMVNTTLVKHFADGPLWPANAIDTCEDTWWRNLLYINNLVGAERMCMAWSWYLANDMQFFVITPIMLIPLYYAPLWGVISCLSLVLVNFLSAGLISKHYELSADMILGANEGTSFTELYVKPWCRVGAYAVGVLTGYILYTTNCKVKMSKLVNVIGWVVATTLALLILYGLWSSENEEFLSVDAAALYNATSRTVWGACICWVVFACATGYGGPVNKLLSWPALVPLSRLTYCAYLIHPIVLVTYYFSQRTLAHWYDLHVVILFSGLLTLSYAVAFVVSLAFEVPMMGLEKAIFGREKNS